MRLEKEIILYFISGVISFLVNIAVYFLLKDVFGINYLASNITAWFFSILVTYINNKLWVFENKSPQILNQMILFYGERIFAGVLDTSLMYLFIDILSIADLPSKIIIQFSIGFINYIFSKLVVFRK